MGVSKIHLSPAELNLFCDPQIILTKNRIIETTISLLQSVQKSIVANAPESPIFSVPPKITRGENYKGLPWVTLDYPRKTLSADICFIRSMFWWGNFYSSTLHISGVFKEEVDKKVLKQLESLAAAGYHICINTDPWAHHFGKDNYKPLHLMRQAEVEYHLELPHTKIAAKWPIGEWDVAASRLFESWKCLVRLIS